MSKELPYMKFWVSDYRNDPAVRLMTVEERGIYLEIIFELWEQGGFIDDDLDKLAKLINVKPKRFLKIFPKISEKFLRKDKKISHKKVTAEIQSTLKRSNSARDNVNKRYARSTPVVPPYNDGTTNHSQSQSQIKGQLPDDSESKADAQPAHRKRPKKADPKLKAAVSKLIQAHKGVLDPNNTTDTPNTKKLVKGLLKLRELALSAEQVLGFIIQASVAPDIDNRVGYCIKILTEPNFAVADSAREVAKRVIRKWTDENIDPKVKDITPDLGADNA